MSVADIKAELTRLTPAELAEVDAYLRALRWSQDPAVGDRIDRAMGEMDAGRKVTAAELDARLKQSHPKSS